MFIIFGGLPGCGKTTLAQRLAVAIKALYLRVDSIEQAIRCSGILVPDRDMGPTGYMAICRIAADNLELGHSVIADSVNPIAVTREAYRAVAKQVGVDFFEVEVVCSDKAVHRHRVETRQCTVEGLTLPGWAQVENLRYDTWDGSPLRLDTSCLPVEHNVATLIAAIANMNRAKA